MSSWHEDEKIQDGAHCGTTHCRAGWVIAEAGKEGYALEKFYGSTLTAAQRIYDNSSEIKVGCVRFFESDKIAMADIERCADEEIKLNQSK